MKALLFSGASLASGLGAVSLFCVFALPVPCFGCDGQHKLLTEFGAKEGSESPLPWFSNTQKALGRHVPLPSWRLAGLGRLRAALSCAAVGVLPLCEPLACTREPLDPSCLIPARRGFWGGDADLRLGPGPERPWQGRPFHQLGNVTKAYP